MPWEVLGVIFSWAVIVHPSKPLPTRQNGPLRKPFSVNSVFRLACQPVTPSLNLQTSIASNPAFDTNPHM